MIDVIFDMETGDPDDTVTLLMLLLNPEVNLKAITCYQGSPIQIGLIEHIVSLSDRYIPVAGWNSIEPKEISPYYTNLLGSWTHKQSKMTPIDLYKEFLIDDTKLLTGAPLTNLSLFLQQYPEHPIKHLVAQGGYLGEIIPLEKRLDKFKNRKAVPTYNLSCDVQAFDNVVQSSSIQKINFVTKDLCHGFTYNKMIHDSIDFKNDQLSLLLKKALGYYADSNKNKAMHDPLAMIYMLYPEIGNIESINMTYREDNGKFLFSSSPGFNNHIYGLVDYDKEKSWNIFRKICSQSIPRKQFKGKL